LRREGRQRGRFAAAAAREDRSLMFLMVTQNLRRMLAPMLPTLPNFHRDNALDLCQRCGIAERHKTANDCINGLREALSRFDVGFTAKPLTRKKPRQKPAAR
jgi:hypothetical protein